MEHWLPLFAERLDTLFDYLPGVPLVLEPLIDEAAQERLSQIGDYFSARKEGMEANQQPVYRPLPPERLYLSEDEWRKRLDDAPLARLSPFGVPTTGTSSTLAASRAGALRPSERTNPGICSRPQRIMLVPSSVRESAWLLLPGVKVRGKGLATCCPNMT
jgi:transcription-repair coupling factor (superfamily II helicase)